MTSIAKPVADNDEFEKQRTAAIAEVAKSKEVKMNVYYSMLFLCVGTLLEHN